MNTGLTSPCSTTSRTTNRCVTPTQRGNAVDAAAAQPAPVTFRDGVATFIIADEAGNPLAGAAVTLDGIDTANTDRLGQVQFRTTRGAHTLTVYMVGYAPFEMEVLV